MLFALFVLFALPPFFELAFPDISYRSPRNYNPA